MALSRRRALLMDDAIRALPLWFRKSCILWYDPKRQGLTNEDIGTDNWKLKNLMDKETCCPYDWEKLKIMGLGTTTSNTLTLTNLTDGANLVLNTPEYHGKIKITGYNDNRDLGISTLTIYESNSNYDRLPQTIYISQDGIYDINISHTTGDRITFFCNGTNAGTTLNTPIIIEQLPTLKGDMKLVNFGKYVFDFTKFGYNGNYADASTVTIESNKITILNNHNSTTSLITTRANNTSTTPFRIKITGIESGYRIRMGHDNKIAEGIQTNFWEFTEDGTYTIYTNLGDYNNFGIMYNKIGDCNVIIEELPEPSSCGRGRYLDTPFPKWTLPSKRTVNIKDTSVELLSTPFYSHTNNAAITFLFSSLSKTSLSHKYKISGIDPDKYEIWFGNDQRQGYISENVIVKATKDGIYTVPWADCTLISNNKTRCIGIHRKEIVSGNSVTDTNINITIEQVPEYEDALVFDGIDDYAILDGYMDSIHDHFYCINRRVLLDNSAAGRTLVASSSQGKNSHFEIYGYDWYTASDLQYGDQGWYGASRGNNISPRQKLLTRNLLQHTLCTPENLQYYSQWGVSGENANYSIKELENSNYKNDKYCISFQSDLSRPQGLITDSVLFPFEKGVTYTLSFDANIDSDTDLPLNYTYFICDNHDNSSTKIESNIVVTSGEWKRYSLTCTFPTSYEGTPPAGKILIGSNRTNSAWTLNIKNIKLELGNKATPYEPALEDFNIKPSRNLTNKFSTAKVSNTTFQDLYSQQTTLVGPYKLSIANNFNTDGGLLTNFPTNLALYSFLLFNRNLTTEEIKWIEENIIPPLPEELSSVYSEGYWKDYTFWRNTDIWRDDIIPDLFIDSGKDYKSVINTDYCPKPVGLYSAKGKTNADTDKNILYDLSGNGNHIKLHNVAFNGMDGYGGYPFNENNIAAHDGAIKIGYNKYQLTGGWSYISYLITQGQPITYNIRVSEIQGENRIAAYCIYSGQVYSEIFNLHEGDNRVTLPADNTGIFVLACPRTDNQASCVVELLPEYPDGLIFNGTNAYGITGIIDKEFKDYTVIVKRKLLNNTGYTCALDDASADGSGNSTFFVEGTDCYSYGYDNDVPLLTRFKDSQYIWQTSDSFCGIPIIRGNIVPNNQKLSIGTAYPNDLSFCQNIVFYSLALFDKKLTSQQIEWFIRNKM